MSDNGTSSSGTYNLWMEMFAMESVDGNPIDPSVDVPFTVLWETQDDLQRLTDCYQDTGSERNAE